MLERNPLPILPYRHRAEPVGRRVGPGDPTPPVAWAMLIVGLAAVAFVFCMPLLDEGNRSKFPGAEWMAVVFVVGVVALVGTLLVRRFRPERPRLRLHDILYCDDCGYDLRFSTGRCPECGRPIPEGRDEVINRLYEITADDD